MKLARRHHDLAGRARGMLPMTPMIDVVFLLLIFFMVTVSASTPESDLASTLKPQSEQQGAAADFQPQIISVEREGDMVFYHLGSHKLTSRRELARLLAELPKASGVVVKVSNNVPVEAAAGTLQTCKDAGFTKVSYVPAS
jgi:biopolymer transport protein ExbD